jgi:hypothetical protein
LSSEGRPESRANEKADIAAPESNGDFFYETAHDLVPRKSRLYDIINPQEDQILFIPLSNRCAGGIEAIGRPVEKHHARDVVIVT